MRIYVNKNKDESKQASSFFLALLIRLRGVIG